MTRSRLNIQALVLTSLLAACSGSLNPPDVSGTYALRSVNGVQVPLPGVNVLVSGAITLTPFGDAHRSVTYRIAADGTVRSFVANGSYRAQDALLQLTLHEGTYDWHPTTSYAGGTLTLRYPAPADGPDVVEVYQRQ